MAIEPQLAISPSVDVLVVDDQQDSADSLALLLSAKGYAVSCAYGGVAALESVLQSTPALVVTDIAMPNFDGMTVAASVNRMQLERPPTLLAYSALVDSPRVAEASAECGIQEIFRKPDDLERLCARIGELITARHA